ncbi:hypothetical protein ACZ91_30345 [Streptomyces regensis]|nr:hypothetical protein ACZ91_30345 [Streptomyces regensis]
MVPRVAAVVPATLGTGMLAGVHPAPAEAATVNTNAWYVLTNRNNGKALDVSGASTAEAAGDSTADSSDDAQGMARLRAPRPIGLRNTVEWAINRLKQSRAVATRYDKHGHVYFGTATVAALTIWLRT